MCSREWERCPMKIQSLPYLYNFKGPISKGYARISLQSKTLITASCTSYHEEGSTVSARPLWVLKTTHLTLSGFAPILRDTKGCQTWMKPEQKEALHQVQVMVLAALPLGCVSCQALWYQRHTVEFTASPREESQRRLPCQSIDSELTLSCAFCRLFQHALSVEASGWHGVWWASGHGPTSTSPLL